MIDPGGWLNSDLLIREITKRRGVNYQDLMIDVIESIPKNVNMKNLREKYLNSDEINGFDRLILNINMEF